jgi:hypothetical protein
VQANLQGVHAPEEKSLLTEVLGSDPLSALTSNSLPTLGQ